MDVDLVLAKYNRLVACKVDLVKRQQEYSIKIKDLEQQNRLYGITRDILNAAVNISHQKFKGKIESTITSALRQIFGRKLSCELVYSDKRGEIDTDIVIRENNEVLSLTDDLGGSIINIVSFIFRVVLWKMSCPQTRAIFVLDEAFNWTGKMASLVGITIKELARLLKFQVIGVLK